MQLMISNSMAAELIVKPDCYSITAYIVVQGIQINYDTCHDCFDRFISQSFAS